MTARKIATLLALRALVPAAASAQTEVRLSVSPTSGAIPAFASAASAASVALAPSALALPILAASPSIAAAPTSVPVAGLSAAAPRAASVAAALAARAPASLSALSAAAMDGSSAKGAAPAAAPAADLRQMGVLELRPTQMSVGMREVDEKVAKLKGKDADAYLKTRPVPVVLGPNGRTYLIDHHHLVRAAWEAGLSRVRVEVKADLSGLSEDAFWERMKKENWVYPYDQLGGGPHDPRDLPENVRGLADDPYRSVAGAVRERGGYDKNDAPFSEFLWAQFFRARLSVHPTYHDFEAAVAEAMKLAKTEAAKHLPGWSGAR